MFFFLCLPSPGAYLVISYQRGHRTSENGVVINCLCRARATSKIWRGSKTVRAWSRLQAAMEFIYITTCQYCQSLCHERKAKDMGWSDNGTYTMIYPSNGNVNNEHDDRHWIWIYTLLSDNHPDTHTHIYIYIRVYNVIYVWWPHLRCPIFVFGSPISRGFLRQESLEKSVWPTTASEDFGQDGHLWRQQGQPVP